MKEKFKIILLMLLLVIVPQLIHAKKKQPNVLFILIDDLGYKDLGCYGSTLIETPNIDRLASEGVRFTQAYASPVCSPTRASLISGQYPARNGIWEVIGIGDMPYAKMKSPPMADAIPRSIKTYADILTKKGYTCAHVGKWHAGRTPQDHGFISLDSIRQIKDPVLKAYAKKNKQKKIGEYTAKAIEFMRENKDKPFILDVHHHAVHVPLEYRTDLAKKYLNKVRRRSDITNVNTAYAAMTEEVDESIGLLLAEVNKLGLADNTVVIFYSDNGGLIGDIHQQNTPMVTSLLPLKGQKGGLYEGGIRVPLIVRWPNKIPAESICTEKVMSIDLYSTILDLGGGTVPKGQIVDGLSLVPLMKQETKTLGRKALYWHFPTCAWVRHPAGAIIKGDYKLIENYETGSVELYNLADDIGEVVDLTSSKPKIARDLLNDFHKWRKDIGAQMPTLNPNFDPILEHEMGKQGFWKKYTHD